jgi:AcrR family transcriptional regulator
MDLVRTMTIGELEEESGIPRSTIYYYVHMGVLFPAQKAGKSWAVYTEEHLRRLRLIQELKAEGRTVKQIQQILGDEGRNPQGEQVDLVAIKATETRNLIIEAAIRRFLTRGYKNTRVADVMRDIGMLSPAFYRFFPDKRHLFFEALETFIDWMLAYVEPELERERDPVVRYLKRARAYLRAQSFGPDPFTLMRAEAITGDEDSRAITQKAYARLLKPSISELSAAIGDVDRSKLPSPEMAAYSLEGMLEHAAMRLLMGGCTERDYYYAYLYPCLAVFEAFTGKRKSAGEYFSLIEELIGSPPPTPPRLTDWLRQNGRSTIPGSDRPETTTS